MSKFVVRQGDAAEEVAGRIVRHVMAHNVAYVENGDHYAQKMVSVVELAKRQLDQKNIKVHQYNKLEIGQEVLGDEDELGLVQPKLRYRAPKLVTCIAKTRQDLDETWTAQ